MRTIPWTQGSTLLDTFTNQLSACSTQTKRLTVHVTHLGRRLGELELPGPRERGFRGGDGGSGAHWREGRGGHGGVRVGAVEHDARSHDALVAVDPRGQDGGRAAAAYSLLIVD